MNVWDRLGIEPTGDLLAIRTAYDRRVEESSEEPAPSEDLRRARDTALLWTVSGFPPDCLSEPHSEGLEEAFARAADEGNAQMSAEPHATALARKFLAPDGFAEARRSEALSLKPHVESFATSLDRQAPAEEQQRWLREIDEACSSKDTAVYRDIQLLLPLMLARSAPADETIELALDTFLSGGVSGGLNELHKGYVASILGA
jgi:hypothetical protein